MATRPKSNRIWHIRNSMTNFWRADKGEWAQWVYRTTYTEDEKKHTSLPQGGSWQTESK